ncbi:hypothetical protein GZH53_19355 [Flavihumibacter sp. R14]|nr:hypothetical protein [Flavihumibacter soli]
MSKHIYAVHLLPLRPDFATSMTDEEKGIMGEHISYWTEKMNQGKVYAFGPVMDPKGVYGLGIIAADSEDELKEFIANDPAGRINRYEYFQMLAVVPNITHG